MRTTWSRTALCLAALAIGVLGTVPAAAGGGGRPDGVPAFGNVFLIIGENTTYSQLDKNSAPYMTGTLEGQSAWLTNYFAITHYSESNYVGMTSGQYTQCEQLDGSPASCHQNIVNLFSQLDGAGVPWQVWNESMPAPCYLLKTGGDATLNKYAPKHNPVLLYDNVEGAGGVWGSANNQGTGAECLGNDIAAGTTGPNDMSSFNQALTRGNVSRFNFIVPNECEDAHDNCMPAGNPITQFDNFVAREVPLIEASPAYTSKSNSVIIVTFDEAQTSSPIRAADLGNGGNVAFAVISPLAHNAIYMTTGYNHYSLLRTLEDGFGISDHLAGAATVSAISNIWN
jgi:hypothetical protein